MIIEDETEGGSNVGSSNDGASPSIAGSSKSNMPMIGEDEERGEDHPDASNRSKDGATAAAESKKKEDKGKKVTKKTKETRNGKQLHLSACLSSQPLRVFFSHKKRFLMYVLTPVSVVWRIKF